MFGWEEDHIIVHRVSEIDGAIPRTNLMLIQEGENTHYSYVKRLTTLLYDQHRHNKSKHFCERCLYGFQGKELLERLKPECEGLLNRPTRTVLPKEGEDKVSFTNYYKQMKASFGIYRDFVKKDPRLRTAKR